MHTGCTHGPNYWRKTVNQVEPGKYPTHPQCAPAGGSKSLRVWSHGDRKDPLTTGDRTWINKMGSTCCVRHKKRRLLTLQRRLPEIKWSYKAGFVPDASCIRVYRIPWESDEILYHGHKLWLLGGRSRRCWPNQDGFNVPMCTVQICIDAVWSQKRTRNIPSPNRFFPIAIDMTIIVCAPRQHRRILPLPRRAHFIITPVFEPVKICRCHREVEELQLSHKYNWLSRPRYVKENVGDCLSHTPQS